MERALLSLKGLVANRSTGRGNLRSRVRIVLGCLLIAFAGLSCSKPRPNVLVVTFDTTRWDHVGWATGEKNLTPMLDAMARRGTWFSHAVTAQPLTLPSHTTILTGLYPFHHGVRNNGTYIVPDTNVTLAERLKAVGYQTHAVISAFVLDSQFGLDQGFDSYDDDLASGPKQKMFMFKETKAEQTTLRAAKWLRQDWKREQPFFMWVHYFDPHADYEPPADIAKQFPTDPYRGEIHYADRELGRLFKELDDAGQLENTLLVFTSDHGDGLGEHGESTHGIFIYDSTTRVPLIFSGPGVPKGKQVDGVVRTADIVPTILDMLGLEGADDLDGKSLIRLWKGKSDPRTAYTETMMTRQNFGWSELRGLRSDDNKGIDAPSRELFDIKLDPGEQDNLYPKVADAVTASSLESPSPLQASARTLFAELDKLKAADPFGQGQQQQADLNQETRNKLTALGYVWDSGSNTTVTGPLPDPKERLKYWQIYQQSQNLIRKGDYPQAAATIQGLLREDPNNELARSSLANALSHMGRKVEALEVFQSMIQRGSQQDSPHFGAAKILTELRRYDEALVLLEKIRALQPENPEVYTALGDFYLEQEKYPEAETWFRKAIDIDPHSSLAASGLGNCLNRSGRTEEAARILMDARKREPSSLAITYNLAVVMDRLGKRQESFQLYQAALQIDPEHSMSWNNLGSLYSQEKKTKEALEAIQKAYALDPDNVEAGYNLSNLLLPTQPQESLKLLEGVLSKRPDFVQAHFARARVLQTLGRTADARTSLQALAPKVPAAWVILARLELTAGDKRAAKAALTQFVAVDKTKAEKLFEKDVALKTIYASP